MILPAPRSLLARTFLLIASLVLLTTAAWLALFRIAEAEPRAREAAQLAASAVNIVRAALLTAAPERRIELLTELTTREGIRLLPAEDSDLIEPLPETRFSRLIAEQIVSRLGPRTKLAMSVDGVHGFWISFRLDEHDEEEFWLILPRERAFREAAWSWLVWGLLALGLALSVAWLIATRINRPLRALAQAAQTIGRGQMPEPLPETGSEEFQQLAAAFNHMVSDLARHERDRSEVLAGISHDLRTPLTRLRLEAELSVSDEQAREGIVADIGQMEAVISQFMDYARGDSGEAPERIDISELLNTLAQRQRAIGRELSTTLTYTGTLKLRPKALSRAVGNLIDNAFKYGGGQVELYSRAEGDHLVIEVADHGPGIPETETERLKRPFTRLEQARSNVTGTGLGLAIVERVARLHDGQLSLLTRPGGGLLARLALPFRN